MLDWLKLLLIYFRFNKSFNTHKQTLIHYENHQITGTAFNFVGGECAKFGWDVSLKVLFSLCFHGFLWSTSKCLHYVVTKKNCFKWHNRLKSRIQRQQEEGHSGAWGHLPASWWCVLSFRARLLTCVAGSDTDILEPSPMYAFHLFFLVIILSLN